MGDAAENLHMEKHVNIGVILQGLSVPVQQCTTNADGNAARHQTGLLLYADDRGCTDHCARS
jgi:hypothetical protein